VRHWRRNAQRWQTCAGPLPNKRGATEWGPEMPLVPLWPHFQLSSTSHRGSIGVLGAAGGWRFVPRGTWAVSLPVRPAVRQAHPPSLTGTNRPPIPRVARLWTAGSVVWSSTGSLLGITLVGHRDHLGPRWCLAGTGRTPPPLGRATRRNNAGQRYLGPPFGGSG
jgi:hypothetical protein